MKAKLKIDRKAIQEFFVQHTEKIVFAGVVVCFALIVYSAAAREMFPVASNQRITPDKLASYAGDAKEGWEQRVPDREKYKTPNYLAIAGRSRIPIEESIYRLEKPFDRSVIQQRRKRGEPPLYAVEGLRGSAGSGRVSMVRQMDTAATPVAAGRGGASRVAPTMGAATLVQGQRWVVLTGLVPLEKQIQDYYDYFKTAQLRTPNDVPVYVGYQVQRVEVSGADAGGPPDWSKSETFYSGTTITEATSSWAQTSYMSQEVADPKFLDKDQRLFFPLPPLVDGQWDESVVHKPEIPLLQQVYQGYPETGVATPEGEKIDDPYRVQGQTPGYSGSSERYYGPRPVAPPRAVFDDRTYSARAIGPMGPGTYMPGPPMPGHYAAGPYGAGAYLPGQAGQGLKYQLFRFFDLKVAAGKRYRYRVRLVLQNPNLGVTDRYLSDEVLAKKQQIEEQAEKMKAGLLGPERRAIQKQQIDEQAEKMKSAGDTKEANTILLKWRNIESDWSDPTDVISVPRDSRLLAISVQPPPRTAEEPSGQVMVVSWVKDQGIEAFREESVDRGKVANFPGCHFPEIKQPRKPAKKAPGELPIYTPPEYLEGGLEEPSPVDYLTDTLVLDMDGGGVLPGKDRLTRPGAILLLDPDGTLVVRHELDDLAECNKCRERNLPPGQGGPGYGYYGQGPSPALGGYGRRPGYDGYQQGRGYDGNLDALRGSGSSYDGPVDRGGARKTPRTPPRRGGAS
jgi:hypothetical protein